MSQRYFYQHKDCVQFAFKAIAINNITKLPFVNFLSRNNQFFPS